MSSQPAGDPDASTLLFEVLVGHARSEALQGASLWVAARRHPTLGVFALVELRLGPNGAGGGSSIGNDVALAEHYFDDGSRWICGLVPDDTIVAALSTPDAAVEVLDDQTAWPRFLIARTTDRGALELELTRRDSTSVIHFDPVTDHPE